VQKHSESQEICSKLTEIKKQLDIKKNSLSAIETHLLVVAFLKITENFVGL